MRAIPTFEGTVGHIDQLDIPGMQRDGFSRGKRYYYFHVVRETGNAVVLQPEELADYLWASRAETALIFTAMDEGYAQKSSSMLTALGRV